MTSDIAIRTANLGKAYRLGVLSQQRHSGYDILGFDLPLQRLWPVLLGDDMDVTKADNVFWALRDLDIEIRRGEAVGIIGKNGSGKSTLLKLLARVTEPSTGFAEVTGQVGSLLEVGTGFHPELTGRQNVFLNGSIMGMSHEQIVRRFDEIVSFAEVEQFIDTPVKHYSSGMYMRLAFSVAAHMECDILIVDEVLAVGDAHFQRKCLARIDSELKSGKTVLFVSHNTQTIMQVCTRCVLFENGRLIEDGLPQQVVESYISRSSPVVTQRQWSPENAPTSEQRCFRLWSFHVRTENGYAHLRYDVKEPITFEIVWDVLVARYPIDVQITLRHESGVVLLVSVDNLDSPWRNRVMPVGRHRVRCRIPPHLLNEGMFMADVAVQATDRSSEFATCVDAASFYVVDDMRNDGVRGDWQGKWFNSVLRPRFEWAHFGPMPIDAPVADQESSVATLHMREMRMREIRKQRGLE
jgi:lipopolysaccharide transport system ATP-binding protein